MAKFKVIFVESYEHSIVVEASSYLEAEEIADRILSKDTYSYCSQEPDWFLQCVQKAPLQKNNRKELLITAEDLLT